MSEEEYEPSEEEAELALMLRATQWVDFWRRVIIMGRLGDQWAFLSFTEPERHFYLGPFVGKNGNVRVKLYKEDEDGYWLDADLYWRHDAFTYEFHSADPTVVELPFAPPEELPLMDAEPLHGLLWVNFRDRLATIQDIWMAHVEYWRDRVPQDRMPWSHGVCVQGKSSLSMAGFNREGEILLEISFAIEDLATPKVEYFDAYGTEGYDPVEF